MYILKIYTGAMITKKFTNKQKALDAFDYFSRKAAPRRIEGFCVKCDAPDPRYLRSATVLMWNPSWVTKGYGIAQSIFEGYIKLYEV